jgi:hypothetical protein
MPAWAYPEGARMAQAADTVIVVDLDEDTHGPDESAEPDHSAEPDQSAKPSTTGKPESGPVHNLW